MEFVRILGNTTGSHIRGSKKNPYGELEITKVKALPFNEVVKGADLVKLDVEGHEKEIFRSVTRETFLNTDGMLSLHDEENARVCYEVFRNLGINMFSQKTGWKKVRQLSDVPTGHTEGSLFVTSKEQMHWERSSG